MKALSGTGVGILVVLPPGPDPEELALSEAAGLPAELFQKDSTGLFTGQRTEILDIHKLKDEMGDKTAKRIMNINKARYGFLHRGCFFPSPFSAAA